MIKVHYLEDSRAQRILWMLEELSLEYEVVVYKRNQKTNLADPALLKIHPLGRSPVLTDGDLTLAESGAIIEYLGNTYGDGALVPQDPDSLRNYRYWLHFAEGTMMPFLVVKKAFQVAQSKVPGLLRPLLMAVPNKMEQVYFGKANKENIAFVEQYLEDKDFFAGETLSGADIMMSFPLEALLTRVSNLKVDNIQAYVQKIQSRPAYQKALQTASIPYVYGPQ